MERDKETDSEGKKRNKQIRMKRDRETEREEER